MLSESLNRIETLQLEVTRLRERNERLRRSLLRMKTRMRKLSGEMRQLSREMRKMRAEGVATPRAPKASKKYPRKRPVITPPSTSRVTVAPKSLTADKVSTSVATSVSESGAATLPQPKESPNWLANSLGAIGELFAGEKDAAASEEANAGTPSETLAPPPPSEAPKDTPLATERPAETVGDTGDVVGDDTDAQSDIESDAAGDTGADARFSEGIVYGAVGNDRANAQYVRAMEWLDRGAPERFKVAMREWLNQHAATDNALKADALYWLGEAYYADEDWRQARHYYTRLVNGFPKSARRDGARLKLAYLFHKEKNYAAAEDILRALLESNNAKIRRLAQARLTRVQKERR